MSDLLDEHLVGADHVVQPEPDLAAVQAEGDRAEVGRDVRDVGVALPPQIAGGVVIGVVVRGDEDGRDKKNDSDRRCDHPEDHEVLIEAHECEEAAGQEENGENQRNRIATGKVHRGTS